MAQILDSGMAGATIRKVDTGEQATPADDPYIRCRTCGDDVPQRDSKCGRCLQCIEEGRAKL